MSLRFTNETSNSGVRITAEFCNLHGPELRHAECMYVHFRQVKQLQNWGPRQIVVQGVKPRPWFPRRLNM